MDTNSQILMVMIIYLFLLILWGLYQGRKVKTEADYAIAGRKLPGWVAALSERATGESSWALLGLPGADYATGLTGFCARQLLQLILFLLRKFPNCRYHLIYC